MTNLGPRWAKLHAKANRQLQLNVRKWRNWSEVDSKIEYSRRSAGVLSGNENATQFLRRQAGINRRVYKKQMMKNQSYEFLRGFENNHINIGFGSYGQVKLAKNSETKDLVAIKLIYNKNAKDEIALHKRFDHPNIIKLLNFYYEEKKHITYMVLEYADGGTLFEKIKSSYMSKEVIRKIFRQVCQAVGALHINGIMHRDIKPQNILLTKKNDAKLCDFGFAALLGERKTLCGTYEYMAPEMVQGMQYDYTVDIWALGILLFEMIAGVAPFRGESPEQVLSEMKRSIYFSEKFDKQEINLIKNILRVNPAKRPSIAQIFDHPYFEPSKLHIERPTFERSFQTERELEKSIPSTHASEEDLKNKGFTPKPRHNESFHRPMQMLRQQQTPHSNVRPNKPLPTVTSQASQVLYNPVKPHKYLNSSSGPLSDLRTTTSTPIYTHSSEHTNHINSSFFHQIRKS